LRYTEGGPIRRIGYQRWRRNLAVAAGNALHQRDNPELRAALIRVRGTCSLMVREHIDWALAPALSLTEARPSPAPG
jgi:epoxyqueuosine reductase